MRIQLVALHPVLEMLTSQARDVVRGGGGGGGAILERPNLL